MYFKKVKTTIPTTNTCKHIHTSQPNTAKQKQDNIFYTVWKTYNSAFPTNQKERNIILEPDIRSTVCKWNN